MSIESTKPYTGEMPYQEYIETDVTSPIPLGHGKSSQYMRRVMYVFPNEYGASVVMGWGAYCNNENPYEVMPMKKFGLFPSMFEKDRSDPYGYIDDHDLYVLLTKILTKERE